MAGANRSGVRGAAWALFLGSLAIQVLVIVGLWLTFDSRLSCDRLIYWGEWLACLHGKSHQYILTAELVVAIWAVGGISYVLARFCPPYVSVLVPVGISALWILFVVEYWDDHFRSRGEPVVSVGGLANLTFVGALLAVFTIGPVIGAWLRGFAHRSRNWLVQAPAVFDGVR